MIKEIIKPQNISQNKYGRYFLSIEAPDDEVEEPKPKSNTKVIDVKPNNRRRLDFTDGAIEDETTDEPVEDVSDDQEPAETNDNAPSEETPTDTPAEDTEDYSTVNTEPTDVNAETPSEDAPAEDNTELDFGDDTDFSADDTSTDQPEETTNDTGADGTELTTSDGGEEVPADDTDGPDVGDDTDFSADAGDDTATDATATDAGTAQPTDQQKGPGVEFDSTRKYSLFLNYQSLINALENYATKLENNIGDDININKILKTGVNKLREIRDLAYEYLMMKFEVSTYFQSLLFYQNLVVMTQSVFELMDKLKKYRKI